MVERMTIKRSPSLAPDNRRTHERFDTLIPIDYASGDNFLFSYIENISEMGIFIRSETPLDIGTPLRMRFAPEGEDPLELEGQVVWINPLRLDTENLNPGMGVRFSNLNADERERIVNLVHTIAYLNKPDNAD